MPPRQAIREEFELFRAEAIPPGELQEDDVDIEDIEDEMDEEYVDEEEEEAEEVIGEDEDNDNDDDLQPLVFRRMEEYIIGQINSLFDDVPLDMEHLFDFRRGPIEEGEVGYRRYCHMRTKMMELLMNHDGYVPIREQGRYRVINDEYFRRLDRRWVIRLETQFEEVYHHFAVLRIFPLPRPE